LKCTRAALYNIDMQTGFKPTYKELKMGGKEFCNRFLVVYRIHGDNLTLGRTDMAALKRSDDINRRLWDYQKALLELVAPKQACALSPYDKSMQHLTLSMLITREERGLAACLPLLRKTVSHPEVSRWPLSVKARFLAQMLLVKSFRRR